MSEFATDFSLAELLICANAAAYNNDGEILVTGVGLGRDRDTGLGQDRDMGHPRKTRRAELHTGCRCVVHDFPARKRQFQPVNLVQSFYFKENSENVQKN